MAPSHRGPLIHLHLPKTAGTTFNVLLRRQFERPQIRALRSQHLEEDLEALVNAPEEERHAIGLLYGHMPFGLHQYLAPGAKYVTVLRDPVERLASHYHYVRGTQHPMFLDAVERSDLTLLEYATSGMSGELENGQTRWIAGVRDDRPLTRADFDQAVDNIERHFVWVGLTEHFDATLVDLGMTMRWPRIYYERRNVASAPRPAVDVATRQEILERNSFDVELHRMITDRFLAANPVHRAGRSVGVVALRLTSRLFSRSRSRAQTKVS